MYRELYRKKIYIYILIEGPKKWKVFNFTFDSPYFIEDFPRDPEEKDEDDGIVENDEDEFGKFSVDTFKKRVIVWVYTALMGLFRLHKCWAIIKYFFSGVRDHLWIARIRGYRDHIIEPLTYDSYRTSLFLLELALIEGCFCNCWHPAVYNVIFPFSVIFLWRC